MGKTKIEWADRVWNPVTGCNPVSDGCLNCYAARMARRLRGRCGYPKDEPFRVTFHPERLEEPAHWLKPQRVFVCSMGDLFHNLVSDLWIKQVFNAMRPFILSPSQHTYLILTKRPKRMVEFFQAHTRAGGPIARSNVWLGVSAEDQKEANTRIPILLSIPAAVHFVSVEPMLGPVDLGGWLQSYVPAGQARRGQGKLGWVIAGPENPLRAAATAGQAGPGARPCKPEWIQDLWKQCKVAGVPFFDKRKTGWLTRKFPV